MLLKLFCILINNRMLFEIVLFLMIFDLMFYYSHRLLHTRQLYKYHKVCMDKIGWDGG